MFVVADDEMGGVERHGCRGVARAVEACDLLCAGWRRQADGEQGGDGGLDGGLANCLSCCPVLALAPGSGSLH